MGNHEYCDECGESDFHHGRPCDPSKVAKRKAETAEAERRKNAAISRMAAALDAAGITYRVNEHGHAEVQWFTYDKEE